MTAFRGSRTDKQSIFLELAKRRDHLVAQARRRIRIGLPDHFEDFGHGTHAIAESQNQCGAGIEIEGARVARVIDEALAVDHFSGDILVRHQDAV